MKNRFYHTQMLLQKLVAMVLLLAFTFITVAQALHHHDDHSYTEHSKIDHIQQKSIADSGKICQICHFSFNKNSGQILPANFSYSFEVIENTSLPYENYLVAFTLKHLSLFSGTSPPTA